MSNSSARPGHVETTIVLNIGIHRGSIVDFETTGRPGRDAEHEVVTLGSICGDKVAILQRTSEDRTRFYAEVNNIIEGLPRPFFSYNSSFEQEIMRSELGLSFKSDDFVDIMSPWKAKAEDRGLKWPRLDELISEPEDYFKEQKISGGDVPKTWRSYLTTRDTKFLRMIMEHCLSDVLREAVLLFRYQV